MYSVRANTASPDQIAAAILSYATNPHLKHLRIAVTRTYLDAKELPAGSTFNLLENSPILQAVALVELPFTDVGVLAVVIDSPGMTMKRSPRDAEVKKFVADLLTLRLAQDKLGLAVQPVDATGHLPVDKALQVILAADYDSLSTAEHEADLFRRMQYVA